MKIGGEKEILHNLPYEAISVTVDKTTEGTILEDGKKILKAGTIVAGDGASIFDDRTKKVKKVTSGASKADGITLHDVDLTKGNAVVALVYAGTVRSDRVAEFAEETKAALPRIQFVKGV
ncbi:Uncharacterised protein [Chlamydia trachomatis]|nr:Uncharacterised protein [Chlamydia trachomatis]